MSGSIVFRVFPSIVNQIRIDRCDFSSFWITPRTFLGDRRTQLLLSPPPILKTLIIACGVAEVVMATIIKEEKYVVYMGTEEHVPRVQELPGSLEP
jgi:hypothetical protein